MADEFSAVDPPEDFGIRQVWADPRSIATNPGNPKDHPPWQTELNSELLAEYGFLLPLVYNARMGRLIDGHDRLAIAIAENYRAVPLWVGEWDEEQEARVIAALNESGRGATYNASRTRAWLDRAGDASGRVAEMLEALRRREGTSAPASADSPSPPEPSESCMPPRSANGKHEAPVEPQDVRTQALAREPVAVRAANTRLVQLIMSKDQLEKWRAWDETLREHHGLATTTDVVLKAMHDAYVSALRNGRR